MNNDTWQLLWAIVQGVLVAGVILLTCFAAISEVVDWCIERREAREAAIREAAQVKEDANQSIGRLQWAYLEAQRRLRDEVD